MTALAEALSDYLTLRHRLGHKLADSVRLLPRFVAWMDATGQSTVTITAALEWCQQPAAGPDSVIWPHRMTAVCGFARYLSGVDPATEIPPRGLLPERRHWAPPYIYTSGDIATLLRGARNLRSPRRAVTYEALFGLLATTGMRVGEAIRLDQTDLDYDAGVVLIRESKFGKSRLIPVDASTVRVLGDYAARRSEFQVQPGNDSFFVSLTGRRLIYVSVDEVFRQLRAETRLGAGSTTRPVIHGLRHSFAVTTLIGWYRDGVGSPLGCRGCRPISAITTPGRPTGICRPRRSSSRSPRTGWSR
jgi:integrase